MLLVPHTREVLYIYIYVYIYISISLYQCLRAQSWHIDVRIDLCMTVGSSEVCFTVCRCYWCLLFGRCCIYMSIYTYRFFLSKPTGPMLTQWCRNTVVLHSRELLDVLHSLQVLLVPLTRELLLVLHSRKLLVVLHSQELVLVLHNRELLVVLHNRSC